MIFPLKISKLTIASHAQYFESKSNETQNQSHRQNISPLGYLYQTIVIHKGNSSLSSRPNKFTIILFDAGT